MTDKKYRVLIGLDRDGALIHDPGYLGRSQNWRDQVKILPGVIEGIRTLKLLPRTHLAVCSNQAGIARGFFKPNRVEEVNEHLKALLAQQGLDIDKWYFCPYVDKDYASKHHILEENPWVAESTDLRKPGIGMLRKAADDIGMKLDDLEVVIFPILITTSENGH